MAASEPPWGVKVTIEGVIAGLIAPLAVGALLVILSPQISEWLDEPTCEDPESLRLVDPISASASSIHTDTEQEGGLAHPPELAYDGDLGSGWVEDDKEGYGKNEWIEFELPDGADLQMVCIVNGYAKDEDLYRKNGRARQLSVLTDVGTTTASLPDKSAEEFAAFQSVDISPGNTLKVRLTIRSTRASAGSGGVRDTAISEVEFWVR